MREAQEKAASSGSARAAEKEPSTSIISGTPDVSKRLATITAELTLRGFNVYKTASDGWLVARWNSSHYCPRIEDLEAFLRRVGGGA